LAKQAKSIYFEAMKKMGCSDEKTRIYVVQTFNRNNENWNTATNDIQFKDANGANHAVRSQTTPIREAGIFEHLTNDDVRGISSNDKTSKHLVNAWETELSVPSSDPTETPRTVFKGLRHRCIENISPRAEEFMQAAISQRFGKEAFDKLEDGAPVELDLSSTQLLTILR
jgi:hypothetical protein